LGQDLQDEYDSEYLPLREAAFSSAFESLTLHKIRNYIIVVAESLKVLGNSILAEKIFTKKPEAVVIVVLFSRDGKISTRRKSDTNIGCDLIASKLGGGGHSYAAGSLISRKNNEAHDDNGSNVGVQTKDVVQALETMIEWN
jgi:nanoRNase/pAp phosphatase (c-di-AMP/oligoRNAs hydrolase)